MPGQGEAARTRRTATGSPQDWPFPARTVVFNAEDRGADGTIVTAISSTPFKRRSCAFMNHDVVGAGFKIEKGETEDHDAEAEWEGNGFRGRWAIRESAQCPGETVIQVRLHGRAEPNGSPGIVVRMSAPAPGTAPRTLADQLRGWSDDALARLLRTRPDLATPTPQDTSQLASRAGTRASVLRAVDQLTRLELTVLDADARPRRYGVRRRPAGRSCTPTATPSTRRSTGSAGLALLWGDDDALRALSVLGEVVGTRICRPGRAGRPC